MKTLLLGPAAALLSSAAYAADLYVATSGFDSNPGTYDQPFRTILAASQAATPGTTIHVGPGNYVGGFTTTASGTASAHIVYVSDTQYGAKIVGGGVAANHMGWEQRGDYVDIKSFEIDGSGPQATSWYFGFWGGGSFSTFQGNKVHDILTDPTAFEQSGGGAGAEMDNYYGGIFGAITGNIVYNIGPSNQTSTLVHGIEMIESGTVSNNLIYNVVGTGITTWHGACDIQIVNNTINNARDGGIVVGSGDSGSGPHTGDYMTVANNIATNSVRGIYEFGTTGVHNRYINNLLFGNSQFNVSLQNGLTATGTISQDPLFVNPAAGDYHLQANSPAIGQGATSTTPTTDVGGNPRDTYGPAIGSYEYLQTPPFTHCS